MYLEDTKHGHSWNAYRVPSRMPSILPVWSIEQPETKNSRPKSDHIPLWLKSSRWLPPTLGKSKGHPNGL